MPWQTTLETARVARIAFAAEDTAIPSVLPNTGASLDWTQTASGENVFGWTANPFAFTEDDFVFELREEDILMADPPDAEGASGAIRDKSGIRSIVFTSYEIGDKIMTWATNVTESSGEFTETSTYTRVAVIIEYEGIGLRYFPSCEIQVKPEAIGRRTLGTQEVEILVFIRPSVPNGVTYEHYQDA